MKKLLFLVLLCTSFLTAFAVNVDLYMPSNDSTGVETPIFVWNDPDIPEGLTVAYDFYFGTESDPGLIQEGLYDGFSVLNDDETQIVATAYISDSGEALYFIYYDNRLNFKRSTKYFWKIIARLSDGNEITSDVFNFTTADINVLPSRPVISYPANNAQNVESENLTISWNESSDNDSDAVSYNVYLGTAANNMVLKAGGLTETEYTVPEKLMDQQKYYLKVTAVDGHSGEEVDNLNAPYVFTVENYVNDAPTKVTLTKPWDNSENTTCNVTLTWQKATDKDGDAVYYDIYLDMTPNPSTLIASDISTLSKAVELENRHETYYWKVVAKDNKGGVSESSVYSFLPWKKADKFMELVRVEGGTFQMGQPNPNIGFEGYSNDEQPVHTVTLDNFMIGKYEVTWAQFCDFLNAFKNSVYIDYQEDYYHDCDIVKTSGSSYFGAGKVICLISDNSGIDYENPKIYYANGSYHVKQGFENYPAENINFSGAKIYCRWAGGRLPTEAEWEYAARGGNKSMGYTYSGSNSINQVGWYYDNGLNLHNPMDDHHLSLSLSGHGTHEVGTKAPNELGIYDMTGNVGELVSDWYQKDYYSISPAINPQGPETMPADDSSFIYRGGDWFRHDYRSRNCSRNRVQYVDEYLMKFFRGFRFAADTTENNAPDKADLLLPANGTTGINSAVKLKWKSFNDWEDDLVAYDVYVDKNINPVTLVSQNNSDTTYVITAIDSNTTYYWKIIAKDNKGNSVESDTWSFSTATITTYTLSGTALTEFGTPMTDVEIMGFDTEVFTNQNGEFSAEVPEGWAGRIWPFKLDFEFTPENIDFETIKHNIDSINFTGHHTYFYYIIVYVRDENGNYTIEPEITAGEGAISPASSTFYMKRVNAGWTGIIKPELEGYSFSPASYKIDTLEEETVIHFSLAPTETYNISGSIKDQSGNPLSGATLSGFSEEVITDNNGNYTTTESGGWSGTITPEMDGYHFTPEELVVTTLESDISQDFTATENVQSYSVTFTVTSGNIPLENGTIIFDGLTYTTDINGQLVIGNILPGTYNYEVTLDGYEGTSGEIIVHDEDITETVSLTPLPLTYNVVFVLTDGMSPVSEASVNFNSENYTSDEEGKVEIEGIESGEYSYQITADGYQTFDSSLMVESDTLVAIELLILNGIKSVEAEKINFFPNPVRDILIIDPDLKNFDEVLIIDYSGKVVAKKTLSAFTTNEINMRDLPSAVYLIAGKNSQSYILLGKVVKHK
ncbi:SUMF1/EgtB/PvdO family nonheme iron enzyme [Saccharicrinis sp. FJH2]|uniref:SUMF1/EgtB/PvdO family nonheme iron enzyme n=1 Tax=Saccharicrinis sp. FJH65 TaxID=3344659 RepID=UPI0035F40210